MNLLDKDSLHREALSAAFEMSGSIRRPRNSMLSNSEYALIRSIAADSTYRKLVSGAEEAEFAAFPEVEEKRPEIYQTLRELGFRAISPE